MPNKIKRIYNGAPRSDIVYVEVEKRNPKDVLTIVRRTNEGGQSVDRFYVDRGISEFILELLEDLERLDDIVENVLI